MSFIILTNTASFYKTVEATDLKDFLTSRNIKAFLHTGFHPPFPFDPGEVIGIVAGHAPGGKMAMVGEDTVKNFSNLKVVMPFGVGVDHIDRAGVERAGVSMKTLPPLSKRTVAELAIAFMFTLARQIGMQTQAMKKVVWERINGTEVIGRTLGIVGLGNIGKETAKIAKALGMRVLVNDLVYDEKFLIEQKVERADLDKILRESDFLTFHVPLTELTKNLVDRNEFQKMKPGVFVINTSRGMVVNEEALLEALESGKVAGAALDVFSEEPPFQNPTLVKILAHPSVLATPHIGAFTPDIRYAIAKTICEEVVTKL